MKDITVFEKESNLHESTDVGMYYCGKILDLAQRIYAEKENVVH